MIEGRLIDHEVTTTVTKMKQYGIHQDNNNNNNNNNTRFYSITN